MVDCCAPFLMLPILVLVSFKVSPAPGHSFPTLQWAMELCSVPLFSATYYNPVFVYGGIYMTMQFTTDSPIHIPSQVINPGRRLSATVHSALLTFEDLQTPKSRIQCLSLFFFKRNRPSFCKTFYIDAGILCFDSTYLMMPNRHIKG